MKFSIDRNILLRSLGFAQSVVERRTTIPILSNIRLDVEQNELRLTATDLDIALAASVPIMADETGGTTVPAHTLYDIVRKLPDGSEVELAYSGEDQRLNLKAGRSNFTLSCLPREDFPVMAEGDLPVSFNIDAGELRRLIDKTRFAISTEETRYYLNGIFVHALPNQDGGLLRAVATDGHRLSRVETALPEGAGAMPGVIIPRKTVLEVRKLIEECDGEVEVALSETKIRFTVDESVLTSKLIDGTFPEYERVIPSGNDKELSISPKEFQSAVDRVATIATDKSRAVKLSLGSNGVVLSATSHDQGNASEELSIPYEREAMEIGFNSRYLIDIIAQVEGELATFVLADATAPTLVRDSSDEGALFVLMPMRV